MISAYRIGDYVYIIETELVADPKLPDLLPIGSLRLDAREAMDLTLQLLEACASYVIPQHPVEA
jgi:hypothetical protein